MTTLVALPEKDMPVSLFTHLVVRETAQLLYGFIGKDERDLFRLLINISGVGPKLALVILSGMTASDFRRCVAERNASMLVQLPGVGKKKAERLLVEIGGSLPADQDATSDTSGVAVHREAEKALRSLGYTAAQSRQAVECVWRSDMNLEQVIMAALKEMQN